MKDFVEMKDIPNYEKIYSITKDGQVWSYRSNRFLKNRKRKSGVSIELNVNGKAKTFSIGKLVFLTWNDLSLKDLEDFNIIHLDGDIYNNNLSNLEKKQIRNFQLDEEIKDIPGYEGLYAITKTGKVWTHINKKFLIPKKTEMNCIQVQLYKNNKKEYCNVHRLVMITWNPHLSSEQLQVNHLDEDRTNNNLDNLEWCTSTYNINYGTRNKRVADKLKKQVRCIETGQIFESQNAVAEFLGQKSVSNISNCLSGKQKTCGGYHWERIGDEE